MNEKEYMNEEKYQKTKKTLIKIGKISLGIAFILIVVSFFIRTPELGEEGWFEASTTKSKLRFAAFVFGIFFPMGLFGTAYRREMAAFNAQQVMPIAKEGMDKMAPSIGNTSKEIAKGIREGLAEEQTVYCKHCGALIDSDSRFCKSCGKEQ